MYKLSYEKCVCFIFLVIVAILSCSGFRIDSLAMTDISKRNQNPHTSSSLFNSQQDFFERFYSEMRYKSAQPSKIFDDRPHRLRHRRSRHAAPLDRPQTNRPRPQSSSGGKHRRQCQQQDVARKAYLANTVVVATPESFSKTDSRDGTINVSFLVLKQLKTSIPTTNNNNHIRLKFIDAKGSNCVKEERDLSNGLVKAQIRNTTVKYFLFLNASEGHNYTVFGTPVRYKRKIENTILRVVKPNFGKS